MRIPIAGSESGEYWTIQHRKIMAENDPTWVKATAEWAYSNYDNIASPAFRDSFSAWEKYGSQGFLTKGLALIALANVRAHSPNRDTHQFRIVRVEFSVEAHPEGST